MIDHDNFYKKTVVSYTRQILLLEFQTWNLRLIRNNPNLPRSLPLPLSARSTASSSSSYLHSFRFGPPFLPRAPPSSRLPPVLSSPNLKSSSSSVSRRFIFSTVANRLRLSLLTLFFVIIVFVIIVIIIDIIVFIVRRKYGGAGGPADAALGQVASQR